MELKSEAFSRNAVGRSCIGQRT